MAILSSKSCLLAFRGWTNWPPWWFGQCGDIEAIRNSFGWSWRNLGRKTERVFTLLQGKSEGNSGHALSSFPNSLIGFSHVLPFLYLPLSSLDYYTSSSRIDLRNYHLYIRVQAPYNVSMYYVANVSISPLSVSKLPTFCNLAPTLSFSFPYSSIC